MSRRFGRNQRRLMRAEMETMGIRLARAEDELFVKTAKVDILTREVRYLHTLLPESTVRYDPSGGNLVMSLKVSEYVIDHASNLQSLLEGAAKNLVGAMMRARQERLG